MKINHNWCVIFMICDGYTITKYQKYDVGLFANDWVRPKEITLLANTMFDQSII